MKHISAIFLSALTLTAMILCLAQCASNEEDLYGTVSGTVTDADTHEPIKGVSITISPQGETKVTGSDGTFSFQEVVPEEQTLSYKHENYESDTKKVSVSAGSNSRADMVLAPLRPKLSVSEASLDFGSENTTLSFDITNSGKGILDWKIEEEIEWLECSTKSGKTEKEKSAVVINISREGWAKGEYSRTMAITSNGGSTTMTVKMQVSGCNLNVSPLDVDLGETESTAKLTITNKGNGTVKYEVIPSNEWIGIDKTKGSVTTKDYVNITINRGMLAPGEYNGQVTIKVEDEQIVIPVKLTISAKSRPVVSFDEVKSFAYNSATLAGTIVQVGNSKITRYGFCYALHDKPTIADEFTNMGDCTAGISFTGIITNLNANTKYYVCVYAENNEGISYSNIESFTTAGLPIKPTVQTQEVTNIQSTSAQVGGLISSMGNVASITQYGHVWDTKENPTTSISTKTELGVKEEIGSFNSELKDLLPNQKYFVRAYATNEKGTSYGETITFTTKAKDIILTTNEVTDIVHNAATCGGIITDFGGRTVKECGICWSTTEEAVSVSNNKAIGKLEDSKWTCRAEGLSKETKYYIRAYAIGQDDVVFYGAVRPFTTTKEVKIATLSKVSITGIDKQGATLQCEVTDNGNGEVSACGFCWSENKEPNFNNDKLACEIQGSQFGGKINGLRDGTKYYVRAYATNAMGMAYSESAEFTTTTVTPPVWGNVSVNNIGKTKVNVQATLTSDGNASVTEIGICWATHTEVSIYDEKLVCANGTTISQYVTGLQGLTTYYLRVYAQNEKGIVYSNEITFTTTDSEVDVWDGVSVASSFAGGSGTETDPIHIETAAQLKLFANKVNSGTTYSGVYFKLTSNINLNNKEWSSIGNETCLNKWGNGGFKGIFDGGNNYITGLKQSGADTMHGLFGQVEDGKIANVTVTANIKGGGGIICNTIAGKTTIDHCVSYGNIEGSGIAGRGGDYSNCIIINCSNYSTASEGGILGTTYDRIEINNCANYGEVGSGMANYCHQYGKFYNNCNYSNVKNNAILGDGYRNYNEGINYWVNDITNNFGTEYPGNGIGGFYFGRNSKNCNLLLDNNKDLVEVLNEWVDDNGIDKYRKWKYITVDGFACPVME